MPQNTQGLFPKSQTPGGFKGELSLETLEMLSEVSGTAVGP